VDFDRFAPAVGDRFWGNRLGVEIDGRLELLHGRLGVARYVVASQLQPRLRVGGLQAHRPLERRHGQRRPAGHVLDAGEREQRFHRERVARDGAVGGGGRCARIVRFEQRIRFLAGFFRALRLPLRPRGEQRGDDRGAGDAEADVARPHP